MVTLAITRLFLDGPLKGLQHTDRLTVDASRAAAWSVGDEFTAIGGDRVRLVAVEQVAK